MKHLFSACSICILPPNPGVNPSRNFGNLDECPFAHFCLLVLRQFKVHVGSVPWVMNFLAENMALASGQPTSLGRQLPTVFPQLLMMQPLGVGACTHACLQLLIHFVTRPIS